MSAGVAVSYGGKTVEAKAWVYIARCADGTYYTGSTTDLVRRENEHNKGTASKYTRSRRPVTFVFHHEFASLPGAISAETRIKQWTRGKKEALTKGRFDLAAELAACREADSRNTRNRILSPATKKSRSVKK